MSRISGCCIVRDAVRFDFPVIEAIKSILPLCDEFIVNVGKSNDGTLELVKTIPGIKILETEWDDSLRKDGRLLSKETNRALSNCSGDWIFYIQADEVLHEKSIPAVKEALLKYNDIPGIQGLLFDYIHFYGSYDVYQRSFAWYQHEVRLIRSYPKGARRTVSCGDAKGFRFEGRKLHVARCGGIIHHYGWVRSPKKMLEKRKFFYKLWHEDKYIEKEFAGMEEFLFWGGLSTLGIFKGTHPQVMQERIKTNGLLGYPRELEESDKLKGLRLSITNSLYRLGIRGSKNYELICR